MTSSFSKRSTLVGTGGWCAVCALVLGVYGFAARSGALELMSPTPADTYYNLLVRGFRAGRLGLPLEAPPGFARLSNPYDPAANSAFRFAPNGLHDLSYYRSEFYLYFGPAPALILFWPFAAITGRYLWHRQAAVIFCAVGFLAGTGLLRALRKRYFPETGDGVLAAAILALGLATGLPVLLACTDVYEVAIACGYMLTMLALAAIWRSLHRPEHSGRWLVAASTAYGLAVAARPSLLPGAACLLVPLIWERGFVLRRWAAALVPIAAIGLGLLLYNYQRFGQPFEFGQRYQLAADRQNAVRHFSARYLWFNIRIYFLEPARWTRHFPFVRGISAPQPPAGHAPVEDAFGILTNIPVLWLALAAPWALRRGKASALRGFVLSVAVVLVASALTIGLFYGSCSRYEVEFLPEFALLAVVGIFAVERKLAALPSWRLAARCGWCLLLAWSVAFNLLSATTHWIDPHIIAARDQNNLAIQLANIPGRMPEAVEHYEQALRIDPNFALAHYNLANALKNIPGKLPEAIGHYEQALRIDPNLAIAHNNLGNAFLQAGRGGEAIDQYRQAIRLGYDRAVVHYNLGVALERGGSKGDAAAEFQEALRREPNLPEASRHLERLQTGNR